MEFYRQKKQDVLNDLGTSENGLTKEQAAANREKYGANELTEKDKQSTFMIFLEQYKDFLVIILIVSAIISGILGDWESTAVILAVITMNAILGTVQTVKAEQSLKGLKAMSAPTAKVIRDGKIKVIPGRDVTIGDVVVIEAGDCVCADGRIIENANLKADESALTGESEPVEKADIDIDGEKALGDRVNMLYSGTFATYGRGKMVVTAVGMDTETGKIASLLEKTSAKKTPLQESLDDFGKKLSFMIIGVCILVFGLDMLRGDNIGDAFIFAVALAVAAIPEALSSIVTIVLAAGTQKLAKEKAVIRKLQSVESLGSVSVICSDKTGTLTQNKMTVQKIYFDNKVIDKEEDISDSQSELIIDSVLCSDAQRRGKTVTGDPTEIALIDFAEKKGFSVADIRSENARAGEIPFDSDRKLMSVVYHKDGTCRMITKGAADVLLPRIESIACEGGVRPFTGDDKKQLKAANMMFSNSGLRVLAVCSKEVASDSVTVEDEDGYTLVGLVAMQDPPREESKESVAKCKRAGIRPIMITGDHLITASAIAREIGILDDTLRAVEGREIDGLSDTELDEFVTDVAVYARVSPEHKIRIVEAWQRKGCIVSMTGDGVNDAPSIKSADIGIGMGITGTDVTKNVADMVLADDNFATIVSAVGEGRRIYDNIRKAIQFLLGSNLSEVLSIFFASIMNFNILSATHLLFINLVTDCFPALALGLEKPENDIMKRKPRSKNDGIFAGGLGIDCLYQGVLVTVLTVAAFYIGEFLETGTWIFRNISDCNEGMTMAFFTMSMCEIFHSFNMRSQRASSLGMVIKGSHNIPLYIAMAASLLLTTAIIEIPFFADMFNFTQLDFKAYSISLALAFSTVPIVEIVKFFQRKAAKRANKQHSH